MQLIPLRSDVIDDRAVQRVDGVAGREGSGADPGVWAESIFHCAKRLCHRVGGVDLVVENLFHATRIGVVGRRERRDSRGDLLLTCRVVDGAAGRNLDAATGSRQDGGTVRLRGPAGHQGHRHQSGCSSIGATPRPRARHAAVNELVGYEIFGKSLLGLQDEMNYLF